MVWYLKSYAQLFPAPVGNTATTISATATKLNKRQVIRDTNSINGIMSSACGGGGSAYPLTACLLYSSYLMSSGTNLNTVKLIIGNFFAAIKYDDVFKKCAKWVIGASANYNAICVAYANGLRNDPYANTFAYYYFNNGVYCPQS
jgi:hypothetical protein